MENAIFDHWLAGETTTKIANIAHLDCSVVVKIIRVMQSSKLEALHIPENAPVYNVWNYASCDPRFGGKYGDLKLKEHPGRIPGQAAQKIGRWILRWIV